MQRNTNILFCLSIVVCFCLMTDIALANPFEAIGNRFETLVDNEFAGFLKKIINVVGGVVLIFMILRDLIIRRGENIQLSTYCWITVGIIVINLGQDIIKHIAGFVIR